MKRAVHFIRCAAPNEPFPGEGVSGLDLTLEATASGEFEICFPESYTERLGTTSEPLVLRFKSLEDAEPEFVRIAEEIPDFGYARVND